MEMMPATENVRNGTSVILDDAIGLQYLIKTLFTRSDKTSPFQIMKECFDSNQIAFLLKNQSPHKKSFDKMITRIVEAGLVEKGLVESMLLADQVTSLTNQIFQNKI